MKQIRYEEETWTDGIVRRIPVVTCGCGTEVWCYNSWANDCDGCGTEYNGSGQRLAPREFWGEETGEIF
jgi:hypothetical protein